MPDQNETNSPVPQPSTELKVLAHSLANTNVTDLGTHFVLSVVRKMATLLREYETEVARAAVSAGTTYVELGQSLGMTRQGAQRRYGAAPESDTSRPTTPRRSKQP
jgi:hypothetical protein